MPKGAMVHGGRGGLVEILLFQKWINYIPLIQSSISRLVIFFSFLKIILLTIPLPEFLRNSQIAEQTHNRSCFLKN